MNDIEHALREHWPPHRVVVECGECGVEILDTNKQRAVEWQAAYLADLIDAFARKHASQTGHWNIDVGIETHPTPVNKIDATITVNGK